MNIQQQCLQTLQIILAPQGNGAASSPLSETALESFYQSIAEETFAFYPEYPPLPMAKSLLWNHDSLRPDVRNLFQTKIRTLWDLAEPGQEPAETVSAEATEPAPETGEPVSDEQPAVTVMTPGSSSSASAGADLFSRPLKPDAFDRMLDMIAALVKGITFSALS